MRAAAYTSKLPHGLFEDREAAWRVTVGGHLIAALHAIPPDRRREALTRIVGDAVVLETA